MTRLNFTHASTTAIVCLLTLLALAPATALAQKDIVATAVEAGQFKTLAKALDAAGLVETLQGPGPFTVFAPTDKAFAQLPEAQLKALLKPENREKLAAILTYHVVAGEVPASEARRLDKATTVEGSDVLISARGGLSVDGASVVKADVRASNGIIHVIDKVMLPDDIVGTAKQAGQFTTLLAAAKAAGLVEALAGEGPITVFAPTDKAFGALPPGTVEDLLKPANKEKLATILKYHVVAGELILGQQSAATLADQALDIRPTGAIKVNEATVALANVRATNGVVHVIDRVLIPQLPETTPRRKAMAVIELAIERGAPLFNKGNPEACAAIYEVAAKSLLEGHGKTLGEPARQRLRKALADIRKDHRPRNQAWTLRHALDEVYGMLRDQKMAPGTRRIKPAREEAKPVARADTLFDFGPKASTAGWVVVNDNVMGGRSKGGFSRGEDRLVFAGSTNTRGGGFSSIRGPLPGGANLAGASGLLVRVRSEGKRSFEVDLRQGDTRRGIAVAYRAKIDYDGGGEWQTVKVPFDRFRASWLGRSVRGLKLQTNRVNQLGFFIYDKKDGPFRLDVDWVRTYSEEVSAG